MSVGGHGRPRLPRVQSLSCYPSASFAQELKDKIPEMQKGELVEVNAEQLRLL